MDLVLVPVEVFVAILVAAIAMIALLATARITGATCLQAARRAAEKHRLASALAVSAGVLAGFLLPVTALAVSTRIGSPVFGLTTPLVVMTTSCLTALVACLVVAALRGRVGLGRTSRATPRRGVTSTLVPEASPTSELVDVRGAASPRAGSHPARARHEQRGEDLASDPCGPTAIRAP